MAVVVVGLGYGVPAQAQLGGLLGGVTPSGKVSGQDVLKNALASIETGKALEDKIAELNRTMLEPLRSIRKQQARQAANWYAIGKSMNDVFAVNGLENEGKREIETFIKSTSKIDDAFSVAVDKLQPTPVTNIQDSIQVVGQNIDAEREVQASVEAMITLANGSQAAFAEMLSKQNVPLDSFASAFVKRLDQANRQLRRAELDLGQAKTDMDDVAVTMDKAIDQFNQQAVLVALDAGRQAAMMLMDVKNLKSLGKTAGVDPQALQKMQAQADQAAGRLEGMANTLKRFAETQVWFAGHSNEVRDRVRASKQQIQASAEGVKAVAPRFREVAESRMRDMKDAAAKSKKGAQVVASLSYDKLNSSLPSFDATKVDKTGDGKLNAKLAQFKD